MISQGLLATYLLVAAINHAQIVAGTANRSAADMAEHPGEQHKPA